MGLEEAPVVETGARLQPPPLGPGPQQRRGGPAAELTAPAGFHRDTLEHQPPAHILSAVALSMVPVPFPYSPPWSLSPFADPVPISGPIPGPYSLPRSPFSSPVTIPGAISGPCPHSRCHSQSLSIVPVPFPGPILGPYLHSWSCSRSLSPLTGRRRHRSGPSPPSHNRANPALLPPTNPSARPLPYLHNHSLRFGPAQRRLQPRLGSVCSQFPPSAPSKSGTGRESAPSSFPLISGSVPVLPGSLPVPRGTGLFRNPPRAERGFFWGSALPRPSWGRRRSGRKRSGRTTLVSAPPSPAAQAEAPPSPAASPPPGAAG
ncbi:uncharacterized protein LOC141726030 isoform X3 [Zonotrichia albicollis]|uniref:uncharacterized protein LOC141726030 isoform X3 n=1 Tax=Zonotrichia albicollis TaxID=44394 RepID=UPI003D811FEA